MWCSIFVFALIALVYKIHASQENDKLIVSIEAGASPLGIYFPGSTYDEHDHFNLYAAEHFLRTIQPSERMVEAAFFSTSLIIRSSDMRSRVRLQFDRNLDPVGREARPYQLTFYNLAFGDRGGDYPLELKHGSSGYLWLDGAEFVAHSTASGHEFTVRDNKHVDIFTVTILTLDMNTEL